MALYRKKPILVEATQWFKNGDHPQDDREVYRDSLEGTAFFGEGKVVRYFRHPDIDGNMVCPHCDWLMHLHGWIDTVQGGHTVCPGDWILNEPASDGYYPCKPGAFAATYERAE